MTPGESVIRIFRHNGDRFVKWKDINKEVDSR